MKNYLMNWNFMRLIRLALGIFIIIQGIQTNNWIFIALGSLFTLMPIFNVGCCSTNSCGTKFSKPDLNNKKEVIYEEVH